MGLALRESLLPRALKLSPRGLQFPLSTSGSRTVLDTIASVQDRSMSRMLRVRFLALRAQAGLCRQLLLTVCALAGKGPEAGILYGSR